jgi:hypothetical protein
MITHSIVKNKVEEYFPPGSNKRIVTDQTEYDAYIKGINLKSGDFVCYYNSKFAVTDHVNALRGTQGVSYLIGVETDFNKLKWEVWKDEPNCLHLMGLSQASTTWRKEQHQTAPWIRWVNKGTWRTLSEQEVKEHIDDYVQNYIQKYLPK